MGVHTATPNANPETEKLPLEVESRERLKKEAGQSSLVSSSLLRETYIRGVSEVTALQNGSPRYLAGELHKVKGWIVMGTSM